MFKYHSGVRRFGYGVALIALVPGLAYAQATASDGAADDQAASEAEQDVAATPDTNEIVVTGTQIRGIRPVGAHVVAQSRADIESSGKNDLNQILAQLPQAENFQGLAQPGNNADGTLGTLGAGSVNNPVSRPNLRNVPGTSLGSGAPTLVMLDGHRLVPVGTNQAVIDVGLIPTNVLDRNEVMLDGASAIYGSDSVGGVINLITRKRYDGVRVTARYGFAEDYWQRDFSVVTGKNWGTGGFAISYEYAQNNEVRKNQRDYFRELNYLWPKAYLPNSNNVDPAAGYRAPAVDDLTCDTAHVTNSTTFAANRIIKSANRSGGLSDPTYCWGGEWATAVGAQKRHSVFLSGEQDISDSVKFDVSAIYSNRSTVAHDNPIVGSVRVAPLGAPVQTGVINSSFYRPDASFPGNATQIVHYSMRPLLGEDTLLYKTGVEFFNVTPQVTANFGSWQARALFNFGQSTTTVDQVAYDNAALSALFVSAINPYDVGAAGAAGAALAKGTLRSYNYENKQQFMQARLVADGPLFAMPGGEVRAAIGAEWMQHKAERQDTSRSTFLPLPIGEATTSSKSIFGEVVVPLVSEDNAMPFLSGLTLAFSGRYDDYGQYGTTFNPRLAATINPVEWITLRGSWGKTFRAPNAVDKLPGSVQCITATGAQGCARGLTNSPSGYNVSDSNSTFAGIVLSGTSQNVRPEKAVNWSVGLDIEPPVVPGLRLSASYWEIHYRDQISRLGSTVASIFEVAAGLPGNESAVCVVPPTGGVNTPADFRADLCPDIPGFIAQGLGGENILNQIGNYTVAFLLDQRLNNRGRADLAGVDASVNYQRETGFGSIDARVSASIPLKSSSQSSPTAAVIDGLLVGTADYRLNAQLGANIGNLRAQASWQFSSSYVATQWACQLDASRNCTLGTRDPTQFRTGQFDTVDLFFRYSFQSDNWMQDLDLTLNVNNVLNSHPPFERTTTGGVAGGQTVGRMVQLGIAKRF